MPAVPRPLTLLDLIVLVAASAAAIAAQRWIFPGVPIVNPSGGLLVIQRVGAIRGTLAIISETSSIAMPTLVASGLGVLAMRLAPPRPRRWRRLWSQPGAIACLAIAVAYPLGIATPWVGKRSVGNLAYPLWQSVRLDRPAATAGLAVVVAWATLGLTGRWRPERSWPDRAGRTIGLLVAIGAACSAIEVLFH